MLRSGLQIDSQRTGNQRRIRRRRLLSRSAIFLIIALVALFAGAGLLAHQVQAAHDSGMQRREIAVRSRELQSALSLLQDAESAQRGLLLTADPRHLTPYEDAARELPGILSRIAAASSHDAVVSQYIREIERLAGLKLAEFAESTRLFRSGQNGEALDMLRTGRGQDNMQELRAQMALAMDSLSAQGARVDARSLSHMASVKHLAWWTAFSLALAIVLAALQIRSLANIRSSYEKQAATQASILNSIVDEIPASLAILDQNLRYRLVNKVFERWRQASRESVIGRTITEVMGEDEFQRSKPWLDRALKGETVSFEKSYPERPISLVTASYSPMFLEDGSVAAIVTLAHDSTAHRNERERLQRLSERDSLTGLLNRAAFETWLSEASAEPDAEEIALLYVDLDHFKPVNDEFGHFAGDAVLREIADRLRAIVRPSDVVARLGGDEFAIGLKGIKNIGDARHIAGKVVAEARRPIHIDRVVVRIAASVGVAADASMAQGGGSSLIARADEMLYRAKKAGRDRFQMHLARA